MSNAPANPATPDLIAALTQALQAASIGSQQAASVTSPFLPPTPKMGGISKVNANEQVAWTGGKPLADWSGLDPKSPKSPISPNQYRSASVSTSQKSHFYRTTGLIDKFKEKDDLPLFEHKVWKHLSNHGMDSISYVPDPQDKAVMLSCVENHSRFTVESITVLIQDQVIEYDAYDHSNDSAATDFLLDSLSPELAKDIRRAKNDNDPFPVVFMHLIKIIRSSSLSRFDHLKTTIREKKASSYAGQDLTKLASDLQEAAKELDTAGQYDHNLTLVMLDTFLDAGGAGNEDFRYPLRALKLKLEEALLTISFMSPKDANAKMQKEGLTYKAICNKAVEKYRAQYDENKWPPARHVKDPKAPPLNFGNMVATTDPWIAAQAYALFQQQASSSSGGANTNKGNCLNCGKPGHWAKDCPSKKNNANSKSPKKPIQRKGAQPFEKKRQDHGAGATKNAWKKVAPKDNEPERKTVDGRPWMWCAKCARWSTSHGTDSHRGTPNRPSPSPQANTLFEDPSAWCAQLNLTASLQSIVWDILVLFLPVLLPLFAFIVGMVLQNITLSDVMTHLHWLHTVVVPNLPIFAAPALWALLGFLLAKLRWGRPSEPPNKDTSDISSYGRWSRRTGANFTRKHRRGGKKLISEKSPA